MTPQARRRTAHLANLDAVAEQAIDAYLEREPEGDEVTLAVLSAVGPDRLRATAPKVHPDRRKQDLGLLVAQLLVDKFGPRRVLTLRGDDRRSPSTRRNTWTDLPWVNRFTPHRVTPTPDPPVERVVLDAVTIRKIVLAEDDALDLIALDRVRGAHPISLAASALAELGFPLAERRVSPRSWARRLDRLDRVVDPDLPVVPGGWELAALCGVRPMVGFDEPTMRRCYRAAWEHLKAASSPADLERPCVYELGDGRRRRWEFQFDRTQVRPGLDEPGDRWRAWSREIGATLRKLAGPGNRLSVTDLAKLTSAFLLMDLAEDAVGKLDLFARVIAERACDAARKREPYAAQQRADALELNLLFGLSMPMVVCTYDSVVRAIATRSGAADAWRLMSPAGMLSWLAARRAGAAVTA